MNSETQSFEKSVNEPVKKLKILLTGEEGFIGSRLSLKLREAGHDVYGFDLKSKRDITEKVEVSQLFDIAKPDVVIHLAALAGVPGGEAEPMSYFKTNVQGTNNLLTLSKKYNVKHFIFYSSSSVYGNQTPPNKEDDKCQPESIYGLTKLAGEMLVKLSGLPYTIIRPFTVYGENGRKDQVIFKWLNLVNSGEPIVVNGDGSSRRGYTYVGDLVDATLKVVDNDKAKNQTFNIGGEEIISLKELSELFVTHKGATVEHRDFPSFDVQDNWADITKAKEILGYKPSNFFKEKVTAIIKE